MSHRTIHIIDHVDDTDPSLVVTRCGEVYHMNDPDVELLDDEAFQERMPRFCCNECANVPRPPKGYSTADLDGENPFLQWMA